MPKFDIPIKLELTATELSAILTWADSANDLEPLDEREKALQAKLRKAIGWFTT